MTATADYASPVISQDELDELNEYRDREVGLQAELTRLRSSENRMGSVWEIVRLITQAVDHSSKFDLENGTHLELACGLCSRVLGMLHACGSIVSQN